MSDEAPREDTSAAALAEALAAARHVLEVPNGWSTVSVRGIVAMAEVIRLLDPERRETAP